MAIHIKLNDAGKVSGFSADTPDEAVEFARKFAASGMATATPVATPSAQPACVYSVTIPRPPSPTVKPAAEPQLPLAPAATTTVRVATALPAVRKWDEDGALRYVSSLTDTHFLFMAALIEHGEVVSDEMARLVGVAPNVLGPIIRTLTTRATATGRETPFSTIALSPNGKRYRVHEVFRSGPLRAWVAKRRAA